MASNHTSHYDLNQWAASDKVLRTEFNADNAKVDAALAGLAGQVAGKASQTDLTALTVTVNTKANQSELTALTNTVNTKANQSDLTSLTNTVATKASQSDLTSLTNTVNTKASQSALNTLTSTVNTKASQSELNTLRSDMSAGDLWVKLADITTTAAGKQVVLDLSDISLTDFTKVHLYFRCAPCSAAIQITSNNYSNNDSYRQSNLPYTGSINITGQQTSQLFTITYFENCTVICRLISHPIWPGENPVFYCDHIASAAQPKGYRLDSAMMHCTWETLRSLEFTSSQNIPAGCKIALYGLR